MRWLFRWFKRVVLGLLALAVLAIAFVLIAVHTDWGRERVRRFAEGKLLELFPGGAKLGRIEGSLLGDFILHDLTLDAYDGKPMVRVKVVKANLAVLALLDRTVRFELLDADDAELYVPRTRTPTPDLDPLSWNVMLPKIGLHHAKVIVVGEYPTTFENVEIAATLKFPIGGSLEAGAHVQGRWHELKLPFQVVAQVKMRDEVDAPVEIPYVAVQLGDARLTGAQIVIDGERSTGTIIASVPPTVAAKIDPELVLPATAHVVITAARAAGPDTQLELFGALGGASVRGSFLANIPARTGHGILSANAPELGVYSPELAGPGNVFVAVTGDLKHLRGTLIASGATPTVPRSHVIVGFDGTIDGGRAVVIAAGGGAAGIAGTAELRRDGKRIELVASHLVASVPDVDVASGNRVALRGPLRLHGTARGKLAPELDLAFSGSLDGNRLVSTDVLFPYEIAKLSGTFAGTAKGSVLAGQIHATATNVSRNYSRLGTFTLDARTKGDRRIAFHLEARLAPVPLTADLDAVMTLPAKPRGPIEIDLVSHRIRAKTGAMWTGRGGHITVTEPLVTLRGLRSQTGMTALGIDATYTRTTSVLDIVADASALDLASLDRRFKGLANIKLALKRRPDRWDGTVTGSATGVVLAPDAPAFDGELAVTIAGRRVTVDAKASTFQLGSVRVLLDVDGPADITDVDAWQRLERGAVRSALFGVTRLDLSAAGVTSGGIVDGELVVAGLDTSGAFTLSGIATRIGQVRGELTFAPMDQGELGATSNLTVDGIGVIGVAARIVFPDRPFDPRAWKQLGRGVIRVLTVSAEDIAIDPAKLAKLGINAPYRGRADVSLAVAVGAGEGKLTVNLRDIRGGLLVQGVDAQIEASTNARNTTASLKVRHTRAGEWADGDKLVTQVAAQLPVTFDQWVAAPGAASTAPLSGKLELPATQLPELFALIGRTEIASGTLSGTVNLGGTLANPTAQGDIVVSDVQVKPRLAGRKIPLLTELRVVGGWDGSAGSVEVTGREENGATLKITARGRPDVLSSINATIDIVKFDLAPIMVFLPGPLVGASGMLDAKLAVKGLHREGKIRGRLAIDKARVPLSPTIGTLRDGKLVITISDDGMAANLDGKLGGGTVKLTAKSAGDLRTIELTGAVRKIAPIGEIQPVISADLTGQLRREAGGWRGDARIRNATVVVPRASGTDLIDADIPEDLYIGGQTRPLEPLYRTSRIPKKPWLVIQLVIDTTTIDAKREYLEMRARIRSDGLTVSVADEVLLDGSIEIVRGDVDVFGRRYHVDPGPDKLRFDNSRDPSLAIRLVHEFPTLTLVADITGTVEEPVLVMSSQPGGYTQDELTSFFLGGDPSGDRSSQTADAALKVGSSLVSAQLGRRVKKRLPFRIDVLQCEAASSATGASCTIGRWLTENWFFSYKRREPRRDENPDHIQIQYYFGRRMFLEASGWGSHFGGDLFWRKRW